MFKLSLNPSFPSGSPVTTMKLFLLFTAVVAYAAAAAAVEVRVSREASADRITSLPGLDEMPSYAMYAGNLRVDEDKTHFYW